jgi:signal peptidase I
MKKLLEVMKADKWMTAIVIVTLVIIILGWSGMLCLGRVHGNSMMPSFLDGDYIRIFFGKAQCRFGIHVHAGTPRNII